MSKYTTEVRFICETAAGLTESDGYNKVSDIIEAARPNIFDFDYPIFDNSYKQTIETKILKHYYTREIGSETVGLWRLWLDRRMNEIMPYFNQLYESARLEFQPFYDVDYTRSGTDAEDMSESGQSSSTNSGSDVTTTTGNQSGTSNATNTGRSNGNSWDYYSDTPQGSVQNIENKTYLTNARNNTDEVSSSGSATETTSGTNNETSTLAHGHKINDTDSRTRDTDREHTETVRGKMGGASYSAMLKEYRETFLNIDMQVIEALSDLFMKLW